MTPHFQWLEWLYAFGRWFDSLPLYGMFGVYLSAGVISLGLADLKSRLALRRTGER